LPVLRQYAKTSLGKPLRFLFQDPRYTFIVGDGRRELVFAKQRFDIIEADAIQPWRSRSGMLYSQEFFQEVQSCLRPGGISVQWNVNQAAEQTFRNVFPYVIKLDLRGDLSFLVGSDRRIDFNPETLLTKLETSAVINFLTQAEVNIEALRADIRAARVSMYSHAQQGQPHPINTDLFPRSEYYLNHRSDRTGMKQGA
jgi:spermidine synthase